MNVNELCFDALTLLSSVAFARYVLFGGHIAESYSPRAVFWIFAGTSFFLPWIFGSLYYRFRGSKPLVRRLALAACIISGVFSLFYNAIGVASQTGVLSSDSPFPLTMAISAPILGTLMGFVSVPDGDDDAGQLRAIFFGTGLGVALCLFGIVMIAGRGAGNGVAFLLIVGLFVGAAAVAIAWWGIYMGFQRLVDILGIKASLGRAEEVFITVGIASLFVLWNEYMRYFTVHTAAKNAGAGVVVTLLVCSGFLPVRILMLAAPPVRILNVVIGSVTLFIYVSALVRG